MDELVPVVLGLVLGAFIRVTTTGQTRLILSIGGVLVAGLAATVLSGEFDQSWIYLMLDLAEAALGMTAGVFIGDRTLRQRTARREEASSATQGQP
jgi:hypothetical protein